MRADRKTLNLNGAIPVPIVAHGPLYDIRPASAGGNRIKNRVELFANLKAASIFDDAGIASLKAMTAEKAADTIVAEANLGDMTHNDLVGVLKTKPALNTKAVNITFEATEGETVNVNGGGPEPEAVEEIDDTEEDEVVEKRRKDMAAKRKTDLKAGARIMAAGAPAMGGRFSGTKAAYERAVREKTGWKGGSRAPIADPDLAEAYGAWGRMAIMGHRDYEQKANDQSIVSNIKELSSNINSLGGATIPQMFADEVIVNRTRNNAITRAAGITTLERGQLTTPRQISDVTVSVIGENNADADQSPDLFDDVEITVREVRGLVKIPNSLLQDSALEIVGVLGDSFDRAYGNFEDDNYLLARGTGRSNSFEGILDKIGANSTNDAALSSSWGDYTIDDFTNLQGKLSDRAWESDRVGYICSRPFYNTNMERFANSAGGNTGDMLKAGFLGGSFPNDADAMWNGFPVWFTSRMPRTYSADQKSVLFGAFDLATKACVVKGTEQIQTSEHFAFANNQLTVRVVRRIAFNAHDVNNVSDPDLGSMVVAMQD